ncbi:DUF4453 domain-containing protein [Gymnodinialimonas ulvae]|uniref:DUF4453 domain-containing protein n=1 Tax=Gymnodinialimonas ulvae TaxID=3126504 RepID=UPI0030AB51FA
MKRLALILFPFLYGAPATAQTGAWCQEIWLSRNTVMDRAGQCFTTPLGQAIFDNSDCTPGRRPLLPLDAEIVSRLQMLENDFGCAVDISATALDPSTAPWLARLAELWTVPIRADTEHGCGGYRGPVRALHAGMSSSTSVLGQLEPGQNFGFAHVPMPAGWEYITVSDADFNPVAHGWVQGIEMSDEICEWIAG